MKNPCSIALHATGSRNFISKKWQPEAGSNSHFSKKKREKNREKNKLVEFIAQIKPDKTQGQLSFE